jgi:ABC-type lipopolysaccharide export system ATPase subunit
MVSTNAIKERLIGRGNFGRHGIIFFEPIQGNDGIAVQNIQYIVRQWPQLCIVLLKKCRQ